MKRTHLPLNALRVFDAAARHLSFTKAADELAVTPAAVGQQIRALEDVLGVVLFKRLTRNLELTPEAERALPALRQGFACFEESVRLLQEAQGSKTLTLAAPRDLAARWLSPRLAAYARAHPDVRFVVIAADDGVDFAQANLDLALVFGAQPDAEGLHAKALGPAETILVGPPGTPPDAPRIIHPGDIAGGGPLTVADAGLALDAAIAGHGPARVPALLAVADVAAGRLEALAPSEPAEGCYWLTAPTPQWKQGKVRALVEALAE